MEKQTKRSEYVNAAYLSNVANSTALLHLLLAKGIITLEEFVEAKIQVLMELSRQYPDIVSESGVRKLADSYKPFVEKEKKDRYAEIPN